MASAIAAAARELWVFHGSRGRRCGMGAGHDGDAAAAGFAGDPTGALVGCLGETAGE